MKEITILIFILWGFFEFRIYYTLIWILINQEQKLVIFWYIISPQDEINIQKTVVEILAIPNNAIVKHHSLSILRFLS